MRFLSPRPATALTPPFRGTGHDFAKIVGRGSTPLGGTNVRHTSRRADPTRSFSNPEKNLVVHALGCDVELICVAVWDGTGFQVRLSSVRFAGGVLIRLRALTRARAAVRCDSRWIVSGLVARQIFLGVAQQ